MIVHSIRPGPAATAFTRGTAERQRGDDRLAIAWFQEAVRLDPTMGLADYHAGELCLWYGRTDEADRHLRRALLWARDHMPAEPVERASKGMNPDAARDALFAALDALEAAGLVVFLNGGTVLGCVRNGGFITFDTDIDLGVLPGTAPDTVVEAIDAASGLRYLYHDVFLGNVVRVRFQSNAGIGGDVFLYQADEAGWWCGVQRGPTGIRWRDAPFGLLEHSFLGRVVLLPDPVERYLEENYGDWRTPDPYHVAAFSAPNLIGGFGAMPRCAAYKAICAALFEGDRPRAVHLGRELLRRDPTDTFIREIVG